MPPPPAPHGARTPRVRGPAQKGAHNPMPGKGGTGPGQPQRKQARHRTRPRQDMRRGTDAWNGPTGALHLNHASCARQTDPGREEGRGRHESVSTHTRKGHAGNTKRATEPSPRNTQTAWNGVLAAESTGPPDGTTRYTQRGERGAGEGEQRRHRTRRRPRPPRPAASTAHTRSGHCTRQGSSGAPNHTPAPRLGSLRASPRGSQWRQASTTGPAAPAALATTY